MTWDAERLTEVADAYERHYRLSTGGRDERQRAEDYWWSWEVVTEGVTDGTLPLEVLDALIHHGNRDAEFLAYVAAGPIEDALTDHATLYGPMIAARCNNDASWAQALESVWLNDQEWSVLPEDLRRRIRVHSVTESSAANAIRGKKPSKRQGKRARH